MCDCGFFVLTLLPPASCTINQIAPATKIVK